MLRILILFRNLTLHPLDLRSGLGLIDILKLIQLTGGSDKVVDFVINVLIRCAIEFKKDLVNKKLYTYVLLVDDKRSGNKKLRCIYFLIKDVIMFLSEEFR